MRKDDGLEANKYLKITLPIYVGAFILNNIKKIFKKFIRDINGFNSNNLYYTDTDSLYIEKQYWDVLDKANLVGKKLCQGKIDDKRGGIFYGFFLASKVKYCLTKNEFGNIQQYLTFKSFNDSKRLLNQSQYFHMLEGKKISAMLPRIWKKSFNNGIILPKKNEML